jgi:hypothetical protein
MPVLRKSLQGAKRGSTTRHRKRRSSVSRARKGERLLLAGAPLMSPSALESVADSLFGMMLTDPDGRYLQVVAVRVDAPARKIYGQFQEMYEAAPYLFVPRGPTER